jgi:hypothetical protein
VIRHKKGFRETSTLRSEVFDFKCLSDELDLTENSGKSGQGVKVNFPLSFSLFGDDPVDEEVHAVYLSNRPPDWWGIRPRGCRRLGVANVRPLFCARFAKHHHRLTNFLGRE